MSELAGRSGAPSRLGLEGRRKLTESAREFPKGSARPSPKGSLREAVKRMANMTPRISSAHSP